MMITGFFIRSEGFTGSTGIPVRTPQKFQNQPRYPSRIEIELNQK